MITLRICLFDQNCEEYPTDALLYIDDIFHLVNRERLLNDLQQALDRDLKDVLEPQGFSYPTMDGFSMQVDTSENIIRLRDEGDVIGEPGNIAMMINLRLIE